VKSWIDWGLDWEAMVWSVLKVKDKGVRVVKIGLWIIIGLFGREENEKIGLL
jgi:hypothetical protein